MISFMVMPALIGGFHDFSSVSIPFTTIHRIGF